MKNTTEIKIDEHNIFEVRNKDLLRWALPVIKKIYNDERVFLDTQDFLDYLEMKIK